MAHKEEIAAKYKEIFDLINSTDGIVWEADATTFIFTFVSDKAVEILGYAIDDWYKPGFWSGHLHPEDRDNAIKFCVEQTKALQPHRFEYRFINNNGGVVWLKDIVTVIHENGKPTLLRGLMYDITTEKEAQKKLRQTELFADKLLNSLPIGIFTYNEAGDCIQVNKTGAEVIGASVGQLLKTNYKRTESWKASGLFDMAQRVMASTRKERMTARVLTTYGKDVWLDCIFSVQDTENGRHLIATFVDITEKMAVQNALAESEEKYRNLYENAAVGIFIADTSGNYTDANPKGCEMLGYTKEELLKLSLKDIVDPEDLQKHPFRLDQLLAGKIVNIERVLRKKDGSKINVTISSSMILNKYFFSIVHDLTERIRAEELIKLSEIRFRSLTEASSDWIWEVDKNAVYTYASPKIRDILGFEPEEVIGKTPFDLMPPDEAKRVGEIFGPIAAQKISFANLTNTNLHKDGRSIILETSGVPFFDENNDLMGYRGVDRDITEKKKIEEALQNAQKLDSLGILAGGIAHDFNNLLSGIFGYLEMARDATDLENAKSDIKKALETFGRARGLTLQLLTFSKGGSPVKQVGNLASTVMDTANFALSGSGIICEFEIADDLWTCEFDNSQISRVIENLVINAKQAMSGDSTSGSGTIKLDAENVSLPHDNLWSLPEGNYIKISVVDQGTGISLDIKNKIFDPFFTTKSVGSGLGLSMAYSIISKHDGAMDFASEPGRGARFFFFLPALRAENTAYDDSVIDNVPLHFGKGKILIMDDEPFILDILEKMLGRFGYSTVSCKNGDEALEVFRASLAQNSEEAKIKAAILDLTIPGGKGGRETVHELLALEPELITIVASGYSSDPILAEPGAYGFNASIQKPFKLDELMAALNKALT